MVHLRRNERRRRQQDCLEPGEPPQQAITAQPVAHACDEQPDTRAGDRPDDAVRGDEWRPTLAVRVDDERNGSGDLADDRQPPAELDPADVRNPEDLGGGAIGVTPRGEYGREAGMRVSEQLEIVGALGKGCRFARSG